jgi:hypothetical protein
MDRNMFGTTLPPLGALLTLSAPSTTLQKLDLFLVRWTIQDFIFLAEVQRNGASLTSISVQIT